MELTGFIEDDYTVARTIDAKENQYPEVTFDYRPFARKELRDALKSVVTRRDEAGDVDKKEDDDARIDAGEDQIEKLCADRIKKWDIKTMAGGIAEITEDAMSRLDPDLRSEFWHIILRIDEAANEQTEKN